MEIPVLLSGKSVSLTSSGMARGAPLFDQIHFHVELPDGEQRTLSAYVDPYQPSQPGRLGADFSMAQLLEIKEEKQVQAEYWLGRITRITAQLPTVFDPEKTVSFQTTDHPADALARNIKIPFSLLGTLLIGLILWSGWVLVSR